MNWPPRDWRSFAALVFSVLGAVALTAQVYLLAAMLLPDRGWTAATEAERVATIKWIAWGGTGAIGLVLIGLGFAINRRKLGGKWGNKSLTWEGGDTAAPDDPPWTVEPQADEARPELSEQNR